MSGPGRVRQTKPTVSAADLPEEGPDQSAGPDWWKTERCRKNQEWTVPVSLTTARFPEGVCSGGEERGSRRLVSGGASIPGDVGVSPLAPCGFGQRQQGGQGGLNGSGNPGGVTAVFRRLFRVLTPCVQRKRNSPDEKAGDDQQAGPEAEGGERERSGSVTGGDTGDTGSLMVWPGTPLYFPKCTFKRGCATIPAAFRPDGLRLNTILSYGLLSGVDLSGAAAVFWSAVFGI